MGHDVPYFNGSNPTYVSPSASLALVISLNVSYDITYIKGYKMLEQILIAFELWLETKAELWL